MSCAVTLEVTTPAVDVGVAVTNVVVSPVATAVDLAVAVSPVDLAVNVVSVVVSMSKAQLPSDLVCFVRPDSTLTYTGELLTRVDYADGRFKTLAYSGSQLITVACVNPALPQTVTKTLGYTDEKLTSVVTVVT